MNVRIATVLLVASTIVPSLGCSSMGCVLAEAREAKKAAEKKKKEEEQKEALRDSLLRAAEASDADRPALVRNLVLPKLPAPDAANEAPAGIRGLVQDQQVSSSALLRARDEVGEPDVEGAEEEVQKATDRYNQTEEHFGVRWGFGPAIVGDGTHEVESAAVVDGKVRVTDSRQYEPKILLETHKFFGAIYNCESDPEKRKAKVEGGEVASTDMLIGVGPFVALSLGGDDVIDGIGFGLMIGGQIGGGASFNIGVGPYLASEVQVLADGFVDGEDAPAGATEVGLEKRSDWKSLVMFSFSWSF